MSYVVELFVPEASPSLNQFAFSHWRKQFRMKQKWSVFLLTAIADRNAMKATGKRRMTIVRKGKRSLDIDNIIGGAKGCITDNLRKFGMLLDDDESSIEFVARNEKLESGSKPHTLIILEDL